MTDGIDWERLPEHLKPAEVARMLRVDLQTVYRWASNPSKWPNGTIIRLPGGKKRRGPVRFRRDRLRVLVEKEEANRGEQGQGQEVAHAVDATARAEHLPEVRSG
jgi:hypothetical protein